MAGPNYTTNNADAGQSFDWTALANNLGPAVIGGAGTYLSGNQLQNSTNKAVGYAAYNPTNISGPGGNVGATRNPDGSINYNVTGSATPALNGLGQFANNAAGAGSDVLSAFKNFNPQQFAQTNYNQLAALQAPKNTDQTQQMLNYEQASGRGGLTQNGQLGDLGGLALAQHLGDTNLRMQAEQLASQRQQQLQQTASGLGASGTNALGGVSNYNNSLMDMLRTAMAGSSGQASAGANQAQLINNTGQIRAGQTAGLTGSVIQGLANSGGGVGNLLKQLYGSFGSGSSGSGNNYGLPDDGTGGYASPDYGSIPGYGNDTTTTQYGTDYGDGSGYGDSTGPFSAAGGEAAGQVASNPQSTDNGSYAGYSTIGDPYASGGAPGSGFDVSQDPDVQALGGQIPGISAAGGPSALNSVSGALGALGSIGAINSGLHRGGVLGYGGAALAGNKLANQLGGYGSTNPYLGPLGSALGVVNGIKQGGVQGYGSAGLNAAALYSGASAANVAAGGSAFAGAGGAAAIGAAALPAAMFAALYGAFNKNGAYTDSQANRDQLGQANDIQAQLDKGAYGASNSEQYKTMANLVAFKRRLNDYYATHGTLTGADFSGRQGNVNTQMVTNKSL